MSKAEREETDERVPWEKGNQPSEYWRWDLPADSLRPSSGRRVIQAVWIATGVALVVAVVWGLFFLK